MQAEREMLATLAVPAVMIDEKGAIQGFNEPAEHLWGWKLTEVVGRNVKMLMPNPERDRHDGYLKRYLETGKQRVFGMGRDVTAVHKDGTMLPVRLSVSEKKDDQKPRGPIPVKSGSRSYSLDDDSPEVPLTDE